MRKIDQVFVATTRSGYQICNLVPEDHEQLCLRLELMTADDHFDSWVVFQWLAVQARRQSGEDSEEYQKYGTYVEAHKAFLSQEFIAATKRKLALRTSIDLMRFAAELAENVTID